MNRLKRRIAAYLKKGAANDAEISFFDVKQLYDAAYAEKDKARVNLRRYKVLITAAQELEAIYRAQFTDDHRIRFGRAA